MLRTEQRIRLAIFTGLPVLFGILTGLFNASSLLTTCKRLHNPPFTIPGPFSILLWLFLYVALGLACYLVSISHSYREEKIAALLICAAQLLLHTFWVIVFAHSRLLLLGAFLHLLYTLITGLTTLFFLKIDKQAGILTIPCTAFSLYYTYITIALLFVN